MDTNSYLIRALTQEESLANDGHAYGLFRQAGDNVTDFSRGGAPIGELLFTGTREACIAKQESDYSVVKKRS